MDRAKFHAIDNAILSSTGDSAGTYDDRVSLRKGGGLIGTVRRNRLAEELEKARAEAEKNGTPLVMRLPFERSYDNRERKFYAMPQPALPDKSYRKEDAPAFFQRPGEEA